jgi:hypothetical protein
VKITSYAKNEIMTEKQRKEKQINAKQQVNLYNVLATQCRTFGCCREDIFQSYIEIPSRVLHLDVSYGDSMYSYNAQCPALLL